MPPIELRLWSGGRAPGIFLGIYVKGGGGGGQWVFFCET